MILHSDNAELLLLKSIKNLIEMPCTTRIICVLTHLTCNAIYSVSNEVLMIELSYAFTLING